MLFGSEMTTKEYNKECLKIFSPSHYIHTLMETCDRASVLQGLAIAAKLGIDVSKLGIYVGKNYLHKALVPVHTMAPGVCLALSALARKDNESAKEYLIATIADVAHSATSFRDHSLIKKAGALVGKRVPNFSNVSKAYRESIAKRELAQLYDKVSILHRDITNVDRKRSHLPDNAKKGNINDLKRIVSSYIVSILSRIIDRNPVLKLANPRAYTRGVQLIEEYRDEIQNMSKRPDPWKMSKTLRKYVQLTQKARKPVLNRLRKAIEHLRSQLPATGNNYRNVRTSIEQYKSTLDNLEKYIMYPLDDAGAIIEKIEEHSSRLRANRRSNASIASTGPLQRLAQQVMKQVDARRTQNR